MYFEQDSIMRKALPRPEKNKKKKKIIERKKKYIYLALLVCFSSFSDLLTPHLKKRDIYTILEYLVDSPGRYNNNNNNNEKKKPILILK